MNIAFFVTSANTVSKILSATTNAVIGNLKQIGVWCFFVIPLGKELCKVQGQFHYTALISFALVISGVFVYRDLIIWPMIQRLKGRKPAHIDNESNHSQVSTETDV